LPMAYNDRSVFQHLALASGGCKPAGSLSSQ
jgi:hypothetical protein